MERDDEGFARAREARARGAERLHEVDAEIAMRDKTSFDVALDELDRQIAAVQEGAASIVQRLQPLLRETYDDHVEEWSTLALDRGASPLAQQIMDRADTLGRLTAHLRTMYGRIDL